MGAANSTIQKTGLIQKETDYSDYSGQYKYCMYKDDVAKIRFAKTGVAASPDTPGAAPSSTLPRVLQRAVERWGSRAALRVERPLPPAKGKTAPPSAPRDQWKTWTWQEFYDDSRKAAKGMMVLGSVRYDGVTILGFNSPEWFMAEMSTMMMAGKAAGVYPTDTAAQCAYKAKLSDASVAICETKEHYEKFATVVDEIPYLKAIVCWDYDGVSDIKRSDGSVVKGLTWNGLLELGEKEGSDQKLDTLIEVQEPGNCCCLVFTSGTTGNPKAVMVSHDNLVFEAFCVLKKGISHFGAEPTEERVISYLPLSHVAGMMVDLISPLMCTAYREGWVTVHFARPYDLKIGTLGDRLRAVQPTLFLGVPRVWEKVMEKLKAVGAQTQGLKKKLSTWAKTHGAYHQKNCLVGGSGEKAWGYSVANVLLTKIKQALGLDECKFMLSGAAPLTLETLEYYANLDININEVYGMSESSGATTWSTDACHYHTSIGYEMHGTEVKVFQIAENGSKTEAKPAQDFSRPTEEEQGELCFRGRHIMMGYLCNPKLGDDHVKEMEKKNKEAIDSDGWMHSGDKGSMGLNRMYRITGRYKELIITAGGENIAPVPIEDSLKLRCQAISNCMMVGDKRKFNTILITLKAHGATGELPGDDNLDGAAKDVVAGVTKISEAVKSKEYIDHIIKAIKETNADGSAVVSNASKIQKFTILPHDFSVEGGEITPSLKLKRSVAAAKYANAIEAMYASSETFVPFVE